MVNIKNRRAWLRIVEATIGVVFILGAVLVFYQTGNINDNDKFGEDLPLIMDEIAKNSSLRNNIIALDLNNQVDVTSIEEKIRTEIAKISVRKDLVYSVSLCWANETCTLKNRPADLKSDIKSYERIISVNVNGTFNAQEIKKIKIYAWKNN